MLRSIPSSSGCCTSHPTFRMYLSIVLVLVFLVLSVKAQSSHETLKAHLISDPVGRSFQDAERNPLLQLRRSITGMYGAIAHPTLLDGAHLGSGRVTARQQLPRMPDLVGKQISQARTDPAVRRLRLTLQQQSDSSSNLAPGAITRQSPLAGEPVNPGASVTVWVAVRQPQQPRMPDLVGKQVDQARTDRGVVRLRLALQLQSDFSSNLAPGTITRHNPAAGQPVRPGTSVTVWVAVRQPRMPDLVGKQISEARTDPAVLKLRLTLDQQSDDSSNMAPGTITRQTPSAGSPVDSGASVTVWVAARQPQLPRMPDLVGKQISQARNDPAVLRLRLNLAQQSDDSSNLAPGTITRQSPLAGELVRLGATVRVWVAARQTRMPDLVGKQFSQARNDPAVLRLRLSLQQQSVESSNLAPGAITRHTPSAGEPVRPGASVAVWLADRQPQQPLRMPDFVRRKIQEVEEQTRSPELAAHQLRIQRHDDRSSNLEADVVTRQEPQAGTLIQPGTTVNLWVAVGTVTVPDVQRQPLETARGILQANQLELDATTVVSPGIQPNTVLSQAPAAGSRVPPGTRVQLTVALPPIVEVPDVTNRPRGEAEEILRGVGLIAQATEEARPDQAPGIVQSQTPAAQQMVAPGTVISLTVSVTPTASSSNLTSWIIGLAGLTALLAAGGYLMRRSPGKPKGKGGKPQVSVRSRTETSEEQIEITNLFQPDYELRLRKIIDLGEQTLDAPGSLIQE